MKKDYLVTVDEMKAYDSTTINEIGMDCLVLMERAALKVTEQILVQYQNLKRSEEDTVLIVCGMGNNGGDGLCVARMLADERVPVSVVLVGTKNRPTKEVKKQLNILDKYGVSWSGEIPKDKSFIIVVDAIFGIGLTKNIEGDIAKLIEQMNALDAYKVAIDIPSGVNADNGKIMGVAFKANQTIAIAYMKRGLFLFPGCEYSGEIVKANIGITEKSFKDKIPAMYTLKGYYREIFEGRVKNGNKGTYGKLLIVAGSQKMAGAAILAGLAAYKAGCGMVKLIIPEAIRSVIQIRLPEALILTYKNSDGLSEAEIAAIKEQEKWANAIVIGPGIFTGKSSCDLVRLVLTDLHLPTLLDADALNIISKEYIVRDLLKKKIQRGEDVVLTPHRGELARLLRVKKDVVVENEWSSTKTMADIFGGVVVGKSARTYVCQSGKETYLNTIGNDRMATAGSGDVLTGVIGTFLAQGLPAYAASVKGVYLHAYAGDNAKENTAGMGLVAQDIINGMNFSEQ